MLYLYEIPAEEEEEEKEDDDDDEEDDIQKLNEKVEKEKQQQQYRSRKHYIWVQVAKSTSKWVTERKALESFVELADENTMFFQTFIIDQIEFKELQK